MFIPRLSIQRKCSSIVAESWVSDSYSSPWSSSCFWRTFSLVARCQEIQTPPWLSPIFSTTAYIWANDQGANVIMTSKLCHGLGQTAYENQSSIVSATCKRKLSPKPLQIHHSTMQLLLSVYPLSFRENTGILKFSSFPGMHRENRMDACHTHACNIL